MSLMKSRHGLPPSLFSKPDEPIRIAELNPLDNLELQTWVLLFAAQFCARRAIFEVLMYQSCNTFHLSATMEGAAFPSVLLWACVACHEVLHR
jgi:hypothetical protein